MSTAVLAPQTQSAEPTGPLELTLVNADGASSDWSPVSKISIPRNGDFSANITQGKDLLQAAIWGKTDGDRSTAAASFSSLAAESGFLAFANETDMVATLQKGLNSTGKKDHGIRSGAVGVFTACLAASGKAAEVTLFPVFQLVINTCGDKNKKVGEKACAATVEFLKLVDKNSAAKVAAVLYTKNTHTAGANLQRLKLLGDFVQDKASRQVQFCLTEALPAVAKDINDADKGVAALAEKCLEWLLATCSNQDVTPLLGDLKIGLKNLTKIDKTVISLASTTFIQNVDTPTLAVMSPILKAGLAQKNTPACKRACARIIENMAKLVEEARDLNNFLPVLLPLLEKARDSVADPEVREVCGVACKEFVRKADLSRSITNDVNSNVTYNLMKTAAAKCSSNVSESDSAVIENLLQHIAEMLVMLNNTAEFDETEWQACVTPYTSLILDAADAKSLTSVLLTTALSLRQKAPEEEEKTDAEELCNCEFSLAYGNKVLLKKTYLKLHRGFKYGLMGPNDCGKTSLMRAIAENNIDGLPDQTKLRTVFVETDIQGELSDKTVIDYIYADELLKDCGVSREDMTKTLQSVGFNDDSPANVTTCVGSLSGGWKMKLALARAMLLNADVLLLDEPTNHLDVHNVKWLQDYLLSLTHVTVIVVSHDVKLLDVICTNIIHFEDNKLHPFRGNLSAFVDKYPEAKCYFELVSSKFTFKFPAPGKIPGINSKGKAIMKMSNITFTYPGAPRPQLERVSVQVALASRVGIVGVNGAGKSTMIKLLTGELEPDKGSGDVYKHPNCRVGYIAQHAFHHIESHLDKTANEYIRWRYETGDDREALVKVTAVLNEAEIKAQKAKIDITLTNAEGVDTLVKKVVVEQVFHTRQTNRKKNTDEFECQLSLDHVKRFWVDRKTLCENGWGKVVKQVDERIALRETQFARPLTVENVKAHMRDVGLEDEFSSHINIRALSTGQKVKVVLGAALWNQPHILILDEPTNYLDRESLGALAGAIREFEGGVIMISHNSQFVDTLCPVIWHLENHTLNLKGDADWMREANKIKISDKDDQPSGETVDKFGNTVKVKGAKKKLTKKEKKARARRRQNKIKNGIEPESEDYSTEEDYD
jgi:elongation factor 3